MERAPICRESTQVFAASGQCARVGVLVRLVRNLIFSDMDVKIWDLNDKMHPNRFTHKHHTEFVQGVDVSMFKQKQIVSVGWDGRVLVYNYDDLTKF